MTEQDRIDALAAGYERLSRRLEQFDADLGGLLADHQDLRAAVAALIPVVAAQPLVPAMMGQPEAAVIDLLDWLRDVYLHYDGAALGVCWPWHAGLVEELTWLRAIHGDVYSRADLRGIGDFHDRYRPGVVKRINEALRNCGIENHQVVREPQVPLRNALGPIAAARAARSPVPAPTDEQITEARQLSTDRNHNR